jgi:uridine phosphorylase
MSGLNSTAITPNNSGAHEYWNSGPFSTADMPLTADRVYHLDLSPEQLSRHVIIVGDPGRVDSIAEKMFVEQFFERATNEMFEHVVGEHREEHRGLRTITGRVKGTGQLITITTSGMGTPSTEIVANELAILNEIDLKTRTRQDEFEPLTVLRIGTSGSLQEDVPLGTAIISGYAVGLDGAGWNIDANAETEKKQDRLDDLERRFKEQLAKHANPNSRFKNNIPVYASQMTPQLVGMMLNAAKDHDLNVQVGVTVSNGGFFAAQGRDIQRFPLTVKDIDKVVARIETGIGSKQPLRVLNMEMEAALLGHLLGTGLGYNVGAICLAIANRPTDSFDTNYAENMEKIIDVAFDAMRRAADIPKPKIETILESSSEKRLRQILSANKFTQGLEIDEQKLIKSIEIVKDTHANSSTPYTKIPSCAAVIVCKDGRVFKGVDLENAAYPSSQNAITGAIGACITAGKINDIEYVLLYGEDNSILEGRPNGFEKDLMNLYLNGTPIISLAGESEFKIRKFQTNDDSEELKEQRIGIKSKEYIPNYDEDETSFEIKKEILSSVTDVNLDKLYETVIDGNEVSLEEFIDAVYKAYLASLNNSAIYSNYAVGAALVVSGERNNGIVTGTNFESDPLNTGICAERNALQSAVSEGVIHLGDSAFSEKLKFAITFVPVETPATPCGACRQALTEVTNSKPIICIGASSKVVVAEGLTEGTVYELDTRSGEKNIKNTSGGFLPESFGRANL